MKAMIKWRANLPQFQDVERARLAYHAAPLESEVLKHDLEITEKIYEKSGIEELFKSSVRICANSPKSFSPPVVPTLESSREQALDQLADTKAAHSEAVHTAAEALDQSAQANETLVKAIDAMSFETAQVKAATSRDEAAQMALQAAEDEKRATEEALAEATSDAGSARSEMIHKDNVAELATQTLQHGLYLVKQKLKDNIAKLAELEEVAAQKRAVQNKTAANVEKQRQAVIKADSEVDKAKELGRLQLRIEIDDAAKEALEDAETSLTAFKKVKAEYEAESVRQEAQMEQERKAALVEADEAENFVSESQQLQHVAGLAAQNSADAADAAKQSADEVELKLKVARQAIKGKEDHATQLKSIADSKAEAVVLANQKLRSATTKREEAKDVAQKALHKEQRGIAQMFEQDKRAQITAFEKSWGGLEKEMVQNDKSYDKFINCVSNGQWVC